MANYENYGIKIIVVMGVFAFLFLFFSAQFLRQSIKPPSSPRIRIETKRTAFKPRRAYQDMAALAGLGPRPAASEAAKETRDYLAGALAQSQKTPRRIAYEVSGKAGKETLEALLTVVPGDHSEIILLATPYDTKAFAEFRFVGANASASGSAWMLEMARILPAPRAGRSLWLLWYEGVGNAEVEQALLDVLRQEEAWPSIAAVVHVAAIGDCLLSVVPDAQATPGLHDAVWSMAETLGYGEYFLKERDAAAPAAASPPVTPPPPPVTPPPSPAWPAFRQSGKAFLGLRDYPYGATTAQHQENWQTDKDQLELLCPESLQAVADVLYHALPSMDAALDELATRAGQ
jgi:hypothetical protein